MKIYLVGNSLVNKDAMPFKIKVFLQNFFPDVQLIEFDPTENFPDDKFPIFIDTVHGIAQPTIFRSIDKFQSTVKNNTTIHAFDFYAELALRKKLKFYDDYRIIGVPSSGDPDNIAKQVKSKISDLKISN